MTKQNSIFAKDFTNLYELSKTLRFELKPSKGTFKKLESSGLFKTPSFKSNIFIKNTDDGIKEAEEKEKNYIFAVNEEKLKELVKKCDNEIEEIEKIKSFLENNPDKLWEIWIDPEKIKIIDKDLKYLLQEKKSWKKSFWNDKYKNESGTLGKQKERGVEWKKGLFLTLDDIDAYFYKERSTKNSERKAGEFTLQVIERLSFLIKQYDTRKLQLLLNTAGDIEQNEKKLFQTKKERVARIRNYLGIFLKLERACSLFNYNYEDGFGKFPEDLKSIFEEYNKELKEVITDIETIFEESNLYLHKNIVRKFSLNIRAINPRPENVDKTTNQVRTEDEIQKEIEKVEKEISDLKNSKAKLKGERKKSKNENHKKADWDSILGGLNPSNKEGLFSKLAELRRDLEEVHITHFAVLLEKDGLFYLALENKRKNKEKNGDIRKISEFKLKDLLSQVNGSQTGEVKVLLYNTLTFKALRRLCLEESGSMRKNDFLDLAESKWKNNKGEGENWRDEKHLDDLKKYLEKITKDKEEKIGTKFSEKDYAEWKNCKNLEELETLIDKQGYKAQWKNIDWKELEEISDIEIFQIYNKDFLIDKDFTTTDGDREKLERIKHTKEKLEEEGEEFIPKHKDEDKKHKRNLYTIYWQNFFADSQGEKYRIKPEGKFYVRLAGDEERQKKTLVDKENNEFEKERGRRYKENKILADFNLWINPTVDKVHSKAKTKEEVKKHIDAINDLHKKDGNDFYILGLDRGLNSLVSYGLFDSNGEIVQINKDGKFHETKGKKYDSQMDFVCGDWSLVSSKGEFAKRENCKFKQRGDLKYFTIAIFKKLKMFYEFEKNNDYGVNDYVNQFEENDNGDMFLEFVNNRNKIRLYILNERNEEGRSFEIQEIKKEIIKENGRPLLDENGNEQFSFTENKIWIVDKDENKVCDYVLLFYIEKAKRIFALQKQQEFAPAPAFRYSEQELEELLFESVDELKEGFTDFVVGEIVKLSNKIFEQKNKKLYVVLEDLSNYGNGEPQGNAKMSFKEKEHERNISVLVYQKLENNLVKKFNFLQTKNPESKINKTQFSPKIQRITDIKELQKKDGKGGQLGNLIFIDPTNTSKECPACEKCDKENREKKKSLLDYIVCQNSECVFSTKKNGNKIGYDFIDGGDALAVYNIAKRGIEFIKQQKQIDKK